MDPSLAMDGGGNIEVGQNDSTSKENTNPINEEGTIGHCGSNSSSCSVDNSRTVINKIANLYAERLMSDVCLVVGNVSSSSTTVISF